MIELNLIQNFNEIEEQEWNTLLQKSSTNTPFQQYGYLKSWWEHKGGGEWPDGKLAIFTGHLDGELIGIAPFFSTNHDGKKKILFLGSIEISDYLDFIYDPLHGADFIARVFDFLANEDEFADIESFLLYNLPESSETNTYLEEASKTQKWRFHSEQAYHTPMIQLAADWDSYLAKIDKKQRHEIRRKLRRSKGSEQAVRWYQVTEKENLDKEIENFFNLMITNQEKEEFLTAPMREQMHSIIHWAFDADLLQLSFLTVEDAKAAAYLCFDYQDRIWVYNSGFDPQFRSFSPGWVMLSYLVQNAIESGKHTFDFMRGDEDYKYRFGADDSFVLKVEISK